MIYKKKDFIRKKLDKNNKKNFQNQKYLNIKLN